MALNLKKLAEQREQLNKGGGNSSFWSPQAGANLVRILPPKEGSEDFFASGYVHYGVGPNNRMINCIGEGCPVCAEAEKLKKSKNKEDQKLASDLYRRERHYLNIIDRNSEDKAGEPQIYGCGKTVLKQIIDIILDPDWGNITDPETGRDITITKTGTGMKTEYSVIGKPKESKLDKSDDKIAGILDKMTDVTSMFKLMTKDEILAVMEGSEEQTAGNPKVTEATTTKQPANLQDYEEWELEDLQAECEKRGLKLPAKITPMRLIALLEADDDEFNDTEVIQAMNS